MKRPRISNFSMLALAVAILFSLPVDSHGQTDTISPNDAGDGRGAVVTAADVTEFLSTIGLDEQHDVIAQDGEAIASPVGPEEAPTAFAGGDGNVGAAPSMSQAPVDAYQRAMIARRQPRPFGPSAMPILVGPGYSIDDWERAYYQTRPDEYLRFVALFGAILGLP